MTEKAITKLNGLDIGDKKLRVSRVNSDTTKENEKLKPTPGSMQSRPSNSTGSFLNTFSKIDDPYVKAMLSIPQTCLMASRVLMFLNMASPEDLIEDDFYNDLVEDVQQECLPYGSIEKVEIPRPDRVTPNKLEQRHLLLRSRKSIHQVPLRTIRETGKAQA